MKSKTKSKIIILSALGILFALLPIITSNLLFDAGINKTSLEYDDDINLDYENLKISATSEKIHIDGNSEWIAFKNDGKCTGNGTYSEPYVIEDLVIDAGGWESGILIENSDVFFKIENCTFYDSGGFTPSDHAIIELSNANNGNLTNNNCSNNYRGIYLSNSYNNTISGNIATNNNNFGIFLASSDGNTLSDNNISYNDIYGICLEWSDRNILSDNNASYNVYSGINLHQSENNSLSNNNASYNVFDGIYIDKSEFNILLGNTVKNNSEYGVFLRYSRNNNIEGNFIINNRVGISLSCSADNEVSNNIFNGNNYDIEIYCPSFGHPFGALIGSMLGLLNITTGVIILTSLTVELTTKKKLHREDEKYHLPINGISSLVVESLGALLLMIIAISIFPINNIVFWFGLFILIPISFVGIIKGIEGLKKDAKKFSARLGIGFGIALLIFSLFLLLLLYLS